MIKGVKGYKDALEYVTSAYYSHPKRRAFTKALKEMYDYLIAYETETDKRAEERRLKRLGEGEMHPRAKHR